MSQMFRCLRFQRVWGLRHRFIALFRVQRLLGFQISPATTATAVGR